MRAFTNRFWSLLILPLILGVVGAGAIRPALAQTSAATMQQSRGSVANIDTPSVLLPGQFYLARPGSSLAPYVGLYAGNGTGTDQLLIDLTYGPPVTPHRQVATGFGLTGGGDLSADRTLALSNYASATTGYLPTKDGSGGLTWIAVPTPSSGTVTMFSVGSWPSWLTPTVSNATTTPTLAVAAGTVPTANGGTGNTLGAEPPLGNPGASGQVLASTTGGARSWVTLPTGGGSTSPAGSSGQIQYNASGAFGASSAFAFNATTNEVTVGTQSSAGGYQALLALSNSRLSSASGDGTGIDFYVKPPFLSGHANGSFGMTYDGTTPNFFWNASGSQIMSLSYAGALKPASYLAADGTTGATGTSTSSGDQFKNGLYVGAGTTTASNFADN